MAATDIEVLKQLNNLESQKENQTATKKQKEVLKNTETKHEPEPEPEQKNPVVQVAVDKIIYDLLERPDLKRELTKIAEPKVLLQHLLYSLMIDTDFMQTLTADKTAEGEKRLRIKAEQEIFLLKQAQKIKEQQLEELKEELLKTPLAKKTNLDVSTLLDFFWQERVEKLQLQKKLEENTDLIYQLTAELKTYKNIVESFDPKGLDQQFEKLQKDQHELLKWLGKIDNTLELEELDEKDFQP